MEAPSTKLFEIALRIKEMRAVSGFTPQEMAAKADISVMEYELFESGKADLPFSFIHKCALIFGIGITDLLEGYSAPLTSYTVIRRGGGQETAKENGIDIKNLAPLFRQKIAEPYFVKYEYSKELQNLPIHLTTHSGQEFDYILSGRLKVQIGGHIEVLNEGDSIYYNSATPHGMIAVGGAECSFLAVVLPGEKADSTIFRSGLRVLQTDEKFHIDNFASTLEDDNGLLKKISFNNAEKFNFAFDIVDAIADDKPDKTALIHVSRDKTERIFSFSDVKRGSAQCANYFKSLGIKRGDKVMLVLKRHYQFWFALLALHKLGAVAIPATSLLQVHDFEYRFNAAGVSAIVCTADDGLPGRADAAQKNSPTLKTKIVVGGDFPGWHNFDEEVSLFSRKFVRQPDSPCGNDTLFMIFTSGTTGYPKIAEHSHTYPLGHYHTAKYWHCSRPDDVHLTISDTGWGKALWGKIYGEWMCESEILVYDFERFDATDILPMISKYKVSTLCAPPTMLRLIIKEDLTKYDFSSIRHMTTAGEALNPEVYMQFEKQTGLKIMEGFGQTETTLLIGNLAGDGHKIGSMGKPTALYDVVLLNSEGRETGVGEPGEICINYTEGRPCGLFKGYYNDEAGTGSVMHDGFYHTGDIAWKDEDGYYWFVGRIDDVIKSSGYRIGPYEIESVIMELPYVLECGVSAVPDELRGQVVKASIVLVKGTEATEELKVEIQKYVKNKTAPYKYPRIIVFRDELPKTISGKVQRNKL